MTKKQSDSILKNIPKTVNASGEGTKRGDGASSTARTAQADQNIVISKLTDSIADLRRELLEITTKLKDGLSSTKRDFNREAQRMSEADSERDRQVLALTKRVDGLESASYRLDENLTQTDQKLSATTMRSDTAVYTSETNAAAIDALNSSVTLLKDDVKELSLSVQRMGKKHLTIRWISLLLTLGTVGAFGIYRAVSLPDVSHVEETQADHQKAINQIIEFLNTQ